MELNTISQMAPRLEDKDKKMPGHVVQEYCESFASESVISKSIRNSMRQVQTGGKRDSGLPINKNIGKSVFNHNNIGKGSRTQISPLVYEEDLKYNQ